MVGSEGRWSIGRLSYLLRQAVWMAMGEAAQHINGDQNLACGTFGKAEKYSLSVR